MAKDKKDIGPLLVKLGVALALSFAGFLYNRSQTRRNKFRLPPQGPRSSDLGSEDAGARSSKSNNSHSMKKATSSASDKSVSAERREEPCTLKVNVDVSPRSTKSGDKDGYLLPEFNDLVKEFDLTGNSVAISPTELPRSDVEIPRVFQSNENDDCEKEIRYLKNMVKMLQDRERNLEVQLLEFYGYKEQAAALMELQKRVKLHNMETKFLTLKIESLQAENKRLQLEVADYKNVVAELDSAQAKIKLLRGKLSVEAQQNREQILALKNRVSGLQAQEVETAVTDEDIQLKLKRLKDLEAEAEELRKSNNRLHQRNSELSHQLETTQILANSILEDPQTEALRELSNRLRQENEELTSKIEQLQADRCTDAEELVYLRWINACLRYELRNFQPSQGKTVARDLSKSLSPKSEKKVKELILEYANPEDAGDKGINFMDFENEPWFSSQASSSTGSMDLDDSSLSPKTNTSSKIKFFKKLRRLVQGKDTHPSGSSGSQQGNSSLSTPPLPLLRHSSRHFRSLKSDDLRDSESGQRDNGARFSRGYQRFSWGGREIISELSPELETESMERSELMKFAGALKDSDIRKRELHRKAMSLDSYDAFQCRQ